MGIAKLATDSATEARLGSQLLADLKVNLWRVDCQTCGRPFRWWDTPALVVYAQGGLAVASLHHQRCRPPGWHDEPHPPAARPSLTWRAGTCVLPSSGLAMFVVNPSYESAVLREQSGEGWQIWTVKGFVDLGFGLEMTVERAKPLPTLTATIDEDRISVEVRGESARAYFWPDIPLSEATAKAVRSGGSILVGVTTLLDVRRPVTEEQIMTLMGHGRIALGAARVASYSRRSQRLGPTDFDKELRLKSFALTAETIEVKLGVAVTDAQIGAGLMLCDGENLLIRRLTGRDQMLAVLPVAVLYAYGSLDGSDRPIPHRGVHIVTPDAATADEYASLLTPVGEVLLRQRVGRLGAEPSSAEGREAYLADIVVGTGGEFLAAYVAYRDGGEEWDLPANRGNLAIVTAPVEALSTEFIQRYPRVAVV